MTGRLRQREHPEAAAEFDAAVAWYEDREPGVGERLIDRAETAREDIAAWPDSWPVFPGWTRKKPVVRTRGVRGFPYRIVYVTTSTEIVIVAYAHERRRPGYWRHRIPGQEQPIADTQPLT